MTRFDAWQRRLRLWTIPLIFCLVNVAAAVIYRTNFADNVEVLQNLVTSAKTERMDLASERQESLDFLDRVESRRGAAQTLYKDYFATREKRLTTMIREAKKLASNAGLQPKTITYPEGEPEHGLVRMSMVFPVEGTYDQLRRFINFLELTDQFLTLERISLGDRQTEGRGQALAIQLELSTVFVDTSEPPREGGVL